MNKITPLNGSRSQWGVQALVLLLLVVGALTTASFLVQIILSLLLPIGIVAVLAVLVWPIVRKVRGHRFLPINLDLRNTVWNGVGRVSGLVDKGRRVSRAATAAIREEWNR